MPQPAWKKLRGRISAIGRQTPAQVLHHNDQDLVHEFRMGDPLYLERFGYKVYSQNDEDGIIAEIFRRIGDTDRRFVEFGVGIGLESNSHFLLHKGWSGLWIEANSEVCKDIRTAFAGPLEAGQLTLLNAFVDKDNINDLIAVQGGISGSIDMLSIDIDGNDYWIWSVISSVQARVVVIEYNAKFPPDFEWVLSYNDKHNWQGGDEYGASLKALEVLGRRLGYRLVATCYRGVNAFFVREDLCGSQFPEPATAENLYNPCRFSVFDLRYISGHESKRYIGGRLPPASARR